MISEIFEFYYAYSLYPERLKPLSREELRKGMSDEAIDKYLSLIEELYCSMSFDPNSKIPVISPEERKQKAISEDRIYNALIKHLFVHNAISDDVYVELHESQCYDFEFEFVERPDNPQLYVVDSLDDFRLSFERAVGTSDKFFNFEDEYLSSRYGFGICVRPDTPSGFIKSNDLYIYRRGDNSSQSYREITYWEARQLADKIQHDISQNNASQKSLDESFGVCKDRKQGYFASLQNRELMSQLPKTIEAWYTRKRGLELEARNLASVQDSVMRIFETMKKPEQTVGNGASLYIYRGNIGCHKNRHPLVPATAILHNEYDQEVQLDVEYCPKCNRYTLNYVSYERYREKYGILIGKLKMLSCGQGGEFEMATESPLKLCGYDVSQTSGLSTATRQFILAKIIHDGILSKSEVIHYLVHFINMNGAKDENILAVEKWSDDLDFVHGYNQNIQPKVYIDSIRKL